MEPDDTGLGSYFRQQRSPQQPPHPPHLHHQQNSSTITATISPSLTNGILPNTDIAPHMVYPHSVPSAVSSPLETVRRKRGRPRKYGTPEQAAAAKRLSSSSPSPSSSTMLLSPPRKKGQSFGGGSSSKKSKLTAVGNIGQGFTPHIINVSAGEDVGQKIMLFMQQSKHEICILSASGSISIASLRQPATSGGNITYEGRFDILSLCGSYVHTELGGRTGGLSVCLSSNDGQILGGGVGGPLTAAGPVEVIVGTFLIDTKDIGAGIKCDASASKLPSPTVGASVSSVDFLSAIDCSGRIAVSGSDDQQNIGGSQFMIQPRGMQVAPPQSTDWMGSNDSRSTAGYEFSGRMGDGARHSIENGNGDYEHFRD